MDIDIQEAKEQDLLAIIDLYKQLDRSGSEQLSIEEAIQMFRKINRYPDYKLYVAVKDRQIVGTFVLLIIDSLAHQGKPSGIVEDVVVHETWRGKGIGKSMMRFAMDYCKRAGCSKLALSSNMRRVAAHQFYESLGFQKHGYSFRVDFENIF
jgi:GNAT superfamily N-acetyltransferase